MSERKHGLVPIKRAPKVREFLTYDLEWYPRTYKLRLVGVFDGNEYRHYTDTRAFLDAEMVQENNGKWFYAHAGGLADIQFFLAEFLARKEWQVDAKFSGSSAVIVRVKKDGFTFTFVDSYWLLKASLREIGKMIGEEKGGDESAMMDTFYAPIEELIPYNEQDCRILWKAIRVFQQMTLELGGELQMTLASTAMKLFRRRYLSEVVPTQNWVNNCARKAYFSSRVEPFRRTMGPGYVYDINSSFPYAMTFDAPGAVLRMSRGELPTEGKLYMAKVKVKVPVSDLPPLPYRTGDGRVYFPTGIWGPVWLSNVDIELLDRCGGHVLSVGDVVTFAPFDGLRAYAEDLYRRRLASTDDAEKMIFKLYLNSLYGKFAESETKESLTLNPVTASCQHHPPCRETLANGKIRKDACMTMLMPGVFTKLDSRRIEHVHVPFSMHITAIARRTLFNYLEISPDRAYCDTDSVTTESEPVQVYGADGLPAQRIEERYIAIAGALGVPVSSDLGQMKLEEHNARYEFLQPKLYLRVGDDGQSAVKAKGFSLKRVPKKPGPERDRATQINRATFEALRMGYGVSIERMSRVREVFRSGDPTPRDIERMKRVRNIEREKRCFDSDGNSRPWAVEELEGE